MFQTNPMGQTQLVVAAPAEESCRVPVVRTFEPASRTERGFAGGASSTRWQISIRLPQTAAPRERNTLTPSLLQIFRFCGWATRFQSSTVADMRWASQALAYRCCLDPLRNTAGSFRTSDDQTAGVSY